ncbi:MAG: XRE family transcriptional regulator [Cytophagales bacterium]|nr:MAG: XRE family transcriptional regulator [Cytophagales bacterium]
MGNDITNRIEQLLTSWELSPSSFADGIGIPRAVISHILSRRNKPSLEVIQKILIKFPQLNALWLLNGKGDMIQLNLFEESEDTIQYGASLISKHKKNLSNDNIELETENVSTLNINNQPSEKITIDANSTALLNHNESTKTTIMESEINDNNNFNTENNHLSKSVDSLQEEKKKEDKKIEKIIIFYSDKSFSIHLPE